MRAFLLAATCAIALVSTPTPVFAAVPQSHAALYTACLSEARWPVEHSAAFVNGSARTKEMLGNSYNASVSYMTAMCVDLNRASDEQKSALLDTCIHLNAVHETEDASTMAHKARAADICRRLAS